MDQIRDLCHHDSSYTLGVCSYCQSFDHYVICCPYYNVSNESYARLTAMIETMNEQHKYFVREIEEFGLLSETDPSLPSPRLMISLHDGCESS